MNSFGNLFRLSTFGESHGAAVGGVVDGMPSGIEVDLAYIQAELDRRRPGQSNITTARDEKDQVKLLSGVFNGKSTGTPIGFVVENTNQHSSDYDNIVDIFRPSHADYTYYSKYGIRDHRGGGRSSARETIARVVGGALAKLMLKSHGIRVRAYTSQVGTVVLNKPYTELNLDAAEENIVRCPDAEVAQRMIDLISQVKAERDSVGGIVTCVIEGAPVGLGEPCFDKLQALLAHAMLSIGAVKGFEYGSGFAGSQMRGSEHNDTFYMDGNRVRTRTNNSGGIQGGISNGEDIYFRVAFKPTATILMEQETVNSLGQEVMTTVKGRHDPCVVPRAVPIVEAMAAMVMVDALLLGKQWIKG
ncbi:MAG: chorismate synthase [Bacteroidales bacterium]|nr:chorismate synthase [Bacteroidales bacterium]MDD5815973.1 chorismate synthase [Bacteroidales bacterium]